MLPNMQEHVSKWEGNRIIKNEMRTFFFVNQVFKPDVSYLQMHLLTRICFMSIVHKQNALKFSILQSRHQLQVHPQVANKRNSAKTTQIYSIQYCKLTEAALVLNAILDGSMKNQHQR